MILLIKRTSNMPNMTQDIIDEMNKRFISKDQFEQQLYTICLDIANIFKCKFYSELNIDNTEELVFDFL